MYCIAGPCGYFIRITFPYIYIFIAIALDESIFLDVLHFPMKNIKSRDVEATPVGGATSKPIQLRCLFTLVVVTLVAYRHDVRCEKLTFWLFQNYVKGGFNV